MLLPFPSTMAKPPLFYFALPALLPSLLILIFSTQYVPTDAQQQQQQQQQPRRPSRTAAADPPKFLPSDHTRNAAVLVSSSRYWHNYRHVSNVLTLYDVLKTGGRFSDEDIILMIADDVQCDGRNPYRNSILPDQARGGHGRSVYGPDVEIDYRGTDVTVDNFLRVLTGRHLPGELPSRKLRLTPDTNLLVMLTGHGGDQFFKFQDGEELTTPDIMAAFKQMRKLGRYNEILFVADTCQAFTLNPTDDKVLDLEGAKLGEVPNVMTVASSLGGQNSYAHHSDGEIGQSVVDRYTHYFAENLRSLAARSGGGGGGNTDAALRRAMEGMSVKDAWVDAMKRVRLGADVGWTDRGCERKMDRIPLCDFLCDGQRQQQQQRQQGVGKGRGEASSRGGGEGPIILRDRVDYDGDDLARLVQQQQQQQQQQREQRRADAEAEQAGKGDGALGDHEKANIQNPTRRGGRRPSDPLFLLSTGAFLFAVVISSRLW